MTAAVAFEPEPVPLVRDEAGRLIVSGTRISLDVLVSAFKRGRSPEAIHDYYAMVSLADVYAVFTYYLRHRAEVDAYLAERAAQDEEIRVRPGEAFPFDGLREKLLARLDM